MKVLKVSLLLSGAALLFSSGAVAGGAHKVTLDLVEKVVVDGKPLNPGTYKVEWDGDGPAVQVTLMHGRDTVATVPAHVTEATTKNAEDGYGTGASPDGSRSLVAIYPGGKRFVLQFDQEEGSQQSGQQPSN